MMIMKVFYMSKVGYCRQLAQNKTVIYLVFKKTTMIVQKKVKVQALKVQIILILMQNQKKVRKNLNLQK